MKKKKLPPLIEMLELARRLRSIETPVFIRCFLNDGRTDQLRRVRIIYPNGRSEYSLTFDTKFYKSCFSKRSLNATIDGMMGFDNHSYLYEVVEL